MSEERELLKKVLLLRTCEALIPEIKELLAQPEQIEQEPVVWQYRCQMDFEEGWLAWCGCSEDDYLAYQTPDMFENVTYETRKLYTTPPKQEQVPFKD